MPRKKIVFIIVEGTADYEALGLMFEKSYSNNMVFVHIVHGDITTQHKPTEILSAIGDLVSRYANSNHFTKNNFKEIIHIVDTDGAYIPDSSIVYNPSAKDPIYSTINIQTDNVQGIAERNDTKRNSLDRITSKLAIGGIPYQVYYMSCNLDHVLFNEMNLSDKDKELNSILFAKKYRENLSGFLQFISHSDFSVTGDYLNSWRFIKNGLHSLERHTNLAISINKVLRN